MNKSRGEQRPQQKGRKRRFSSGKRATHWDSSITSNIIEKADRLHSGFTFSAPPLELNLSVYPRVPRMDGQARLLTTGTIEEKIYQRQISKASLSESVVDLNHLGSLKLSTAELKDLFTLANDTISLTHDLMNCSCSGQNEHILSEELKEKNETRDCQFLLYDQSPQQNLTINQLQDWQHYKQPFPSDVMQDIMLKEISDNITFIFKNSTCKEHNLIK